MMLLVTTWPVNLDESWTFCGNIPNWIRFIAWPMIMFLEFYSVSGDSKALAGFYRVSFFFALYYADNLDMKRREVLILDILWSAFCNSVRIRATLFDCFQCKYNSLWSSLHGRSLISYVIKSALQYIHVDVGENFLASHKYCHRVKVVNNFVSHTCVCNLCKRQYGLFTSSINNSTPTRLVQ